MFTNPGERSKTRHCCNDQVLRAIGVAIVKAGTMFPTMELLLVCVRADAAVGVVVVVCVSSCDGNLCADAAARDQLPEHDKEQGRQRRWHHRQ